MSISNPAHNNAVRAQSKPSHLFVVYSLVVHQAKLLVCKPRSGDTSNSMSLYLWWSGIRLLFPKLNTTSLPLSDTSSYLGDTVSC